MTTFAIFAIASLWAIALVGVPVAAFYEGR
jgi:hypothetical protein